MKKLMTLFLSLALVVGVLAACGNKDDNNKAAENANEENPENAEELNIPEPDLEGIPDVVAEVNDEEISKEDFEGMYQQQFQNYVMQAQMSGQDMNDIDQDEIKLQVVDSMVGQQLIIQEANAKVDSVSDEEVEKELEDIVEQFGMEDKKELMAAFEEQGMDEAEVMDQVETQVKVDKLLVDSMGDFEPSEEEVKDAYEEVKKQQEEMESEEEVPEYDEIKDSLKEQLISQKKSEKTNELVEELRKEAKIKVHI